MRIRLLALAAGCAAALLVDPAAAAPRCDRIAARIQNLQQLPVANLGRLRRLQRRYADRCVRLNQIQVLGSHNSYHRLPRPTLLSVLLALDPLFEGFVYEHAPLDVQFETQGIRQIELDVFYDPLGGHYGTRKVLPLLGEDGMAPPVMFEPGMKVFHVQEVDFETTCATLVECLETIRNWSSDNRRHLPIVVLIEAKDDPIIDPLNLGFAVPLPFDEAAFDALDAEIRSVFPPRKLITPDDVRGTHATLEEAILTDGWPTLREARGKVMFLLDNEGKQAIYTAGHPNLEGRVLFTNADPGDPDAAFVKRNDPIGDTDIPSLVQAGYLVRTRADADTVQSRTNDPTQRDAALASGAQFVSTDYPVPNLDFSPYVVEIPGGHTARCNPLNAPPACEDSVLEILP
ncbi:MAG TPA: phosphatidylinositol-specific phospholipase C1-like protein [Candidatus Limnocylindria bacterium]|nr:phosphatidylinositol-specific phospholipase C1-like protein [Candidatus Limnocylindria bacterium]